MRMPNCLNSDEHQYGVNSALGRTSIWVHFSSSGSSENGLRVYGHCDDIKKICLDLRYALVIPTISKYAKELINGAAFKNTTQIYLTALLNQLHNHDIQQSHKIPPSRNPPHKTNTFTSSPNILSKHTFPLISHRLAAYHTFQQNLPAKIIRIRSLLNPTRSNTLIKHLLTLYHVEGAPWVESKS